MVAGDAKSPQVRAERAGSTNAEIPVAVSALVAVATVFMLNAMRVFVSYLVFVIDQSNRVELGTVTIGVFLSIALAPVLVRLLGARVTLLTTGLSLVLSRLVLQFWPAPEARIVFGAAVIVLWGWLMITLLAWMRSAVALGFVLGLALDLAVRIAFATLDLPWMPGLAAHGVTIGLAALALLSLLRLIGRRCDLATSGGRAAAAVVIGPALVLFHLVTGNIGLVQIKTALNFPAAAAVMSAGVVIGLGGIAYLMSPRYPSLRWQQLIFPGLLLVAALGLVIFWLNETLAAIGLVTGVAATLILLAGALLGRAENARDASPGRVSFWFTLGMLAQVVTLFAYYTFSGLPALIVLAGIAFGASARAGWAQPRLGWRPPAALGSWPLAAVALLLVVCSGWQFMRRDEPPAAPMPGRNLTVMTYNIQSGFGIDNDWSLERTSRTIEAAQPDIVVLQEVSRGWLVTTGVDQIHWLAQRLDMHVFFGGNSDDGLWGNAILSRAPLQAVELHRFTETENLKRGMVGARVETEAGPLWVFGTHLDNPRGAGGVRLQQVDELLRAWDERAPSILLGDLNAEPDDDVLARLSKAGFADLGAALGPNDVTSEDGRRIDYILATSTIVVRSIEIPDTDASDHKPVVATISLNP